jgi:hypothetical protein
MFVTPCEIIDIGDRITSTTALDLPTTDPTRRRDSGASRAIDYLTPEAIQWNDRARRGRRVALGVRSGGIQ